MKYHNTNKDILIMKKEKLFRKIIARVRNNLKYHIISLFCYTC